MPYNEPIDPTAYKDLGLLDSAANRPFQTFGGEDLYPTIFGKAAALFHSLACNHCFFNGNKRTAVMALDLFLAANGCTLVLRSIDIYHLAKRAAEANKVGVKADTLLDEIARTVRSKSFPFDALLADELKGMKGIREFHQHSLEAQTQIQNHPLNQEERILVPSR
jgi:death-on-curing protein